MKKRYPIGAGMIVCRDFGDLGIKVLVLKSSDGLWDLPKGRLDSGETLFQCAVRETFEEACISQMDFPWDQTSISLQNLTFYICFTFENPKIIPNPVYGNYEHESAWWVDPLDALEILPEFLKPAMQWAIDTIDL
jgi:8-oxo-dGTP pyrophosphatase MutT (NUDIX family)